MNGLINMVGWSRMLNGHIVPHAELPDGTPTTLLAVDQTALRQVRHDVVRATDPQVARDVTGRLLQIRRDFSDTFDEDVDLPVYGSEDPGQSGMPMSVFLAPKRVWWADVQLPLETAGEIGYERWKTVQVWLARIAPVFDALPELPPGPILWNANFEGSLQDGPLVQQRLDFAAARKEIEVAAEGTTITTTASKHFERAWLNEENVAERALVSAVIDGLAQLAGSGTEAQKSTWLDAVVTHPLARQQHGFVARSFRDWLRSDVQGKVVTITREDDAATRLGLGWKVRDRTLEPWIEGKAECNAFLGVLVRELEEETCSSTSRLRACRNHKSTTSKSRESCVRPRSLESNGGKQYCAATRSNCSDGNAGGTSGAPFCRFAWVAPAHRDGSL